MNKYKQKRNIKVSTGWPDKNTINIESNKAVFALFREEPKRRAASLFVMFSGEDETDEELGEKESELCFVAVVYSAKDIAGIVRRAPQFKYHVLFGNFRPLQTCASVFVDGKNLDTLKDEWTP